MSRDEETGEICSPVDSGNRLEDIVMSTPFLTALAMIAFAANSVLCRMALGSSTIDAASFTSLRLLSGAATLAIILYSRERGRARIKYDLIAASGLFIYAICFSFSYIHLTAATGALILFATVQLTMVLVGIIRGDRPTAMVWAGMVVAFSGLLYLLLPGVTAPPLPSAGLMLVAGLAWAVYTLRGKSATNPVANTAANFIATVPLALLVTLVFHSQMSLSAQGVVLALLSGGVASSLGYVIWYRALPHLAPTHAATVQLSVPILAALGGVWLTSEPLTLRLVVSGGVVLGGIYLTMAARGRNKA